MKKLLKRKSILIVALAILLIGTSVAVTLAYLSSQTPTLTNTFTVGNVTTKIVEDFEPVDIDTYNKTPRVKNTGANDCYVRMRVVCSPEGAFEELDINDAYWKYHEEDGFYYYENNGGYIILPAPKSENDPNAETPEIFSKVVLKEGIAENIDGFEVTVYQEAVQTIVYAKDGTFEDDPVEIWKWYDEAEQGDVPDHFD